VNAGQCYALGGASYQVSCNAEGTKANYKLWGLSTTCVGTPDSSVDDGPAVCEPGSSGTYWYEIICTPSASFNPVVVTQYSDSGCTTKTNSDNLINGDCYALGTTAWSLTCNDAGTSITENFWATVTDCSGTYTSTSTESPNTCSESADQTYYYQITCPTTGGGPTPQTTGGPTPPTAAPSNAISLAFSFLFTASLLLLISL